MSKPSIIFLLAILLAGCTGKVSGQATPAADSVSDQNQPSSPVSVSNGLTAEETAPADAIPTGAAILLRVYPDQVIGYEDGRLLMADGTRIVYDDGREKDFVTMLDESDPEDMFSMTYDPKVWEPEYLADAGRSRCEELFKSMYGHSAAEAQRRLTRVAWFGQQLQFTGVNGAADSLRAVAKEMQQHPELVKYMKQASTFYWRPVRGAKRQSAHSYGIAIDINTSLSNYWLWSNPGAKELDRLKYENRVPREVVTIFERHGFIWGGRWYHYDTMHFEFRPEFLTN